MSIASFEGKGMYRLDYTTLEEVGRGDTVTKEVTAFFLAETPEEAIAGLREALAPEAVTVVNVTLALEGENLRYKVPVMN